MTDFRADLHIHTTASDGVLSPSQVVFRARECGLNLIAITDHDTSAGNADAAGTAAQEGMTLLSGAEISAGGEPEVHLLGYGFSRESKRLTALFEQMKAERKLRAEKILEKLHRIGRPIMEEELQPGASGIIGRPLIARAMVRKGYAADVRQAFDRYLGKGRAAYVPRSLPSPEYVIRLLREEGAVPVLAHPALLHMEEVEIRKQVFFWKDCGLMGMEVYHPAHAPRSFASWKKLAKEAELLVTGGSDFHQSGDKHAEIAEMLPYWQSCAEDCHRLLEAMEACGNGFK